jgi:hypothetical protein
MLKVFFSLVGLNHYMDVQQSQQEFQISTNTVPFYPFTMLRNAMFPKPQCYNETKEFSANSDHVKKTTQNLDCAPCNKDHLCGLVVRVLGLERGPLSLVSTTEELLERKSSGLENREYGHRDPSR